MSGHLFTSTAQPHSKFAQITRKTTFQAKINSPAARLKRKVGSLRSPIGDPPFTEHPRHLPGGGRFPCFRARRRRRSCTCAEPAACATRRCSTRNPSSWPTSQRSTGAASIRARTHACSLNRRFGGSSEVEMAPSTRGPPLA